MMISQKDFLILLPGVRSAVINPGLSRTYSAAPPISHFHSRSGRRGRSENKKLFVLFGENKELFCFPEEPLRQGFEWNANPKSKGVNEAQSGINPRIVNVSAGKSKQFFVGN